MKLTIFYIRLVRIGSMQRLLSVYSYEHPRLAYTSLGVGYLLAIAMLLFIAMHTDLVVPSQALLSNLFV